MFAYRRVLFRSVSNLVFIGIWPCSAWRSWFWIFVEAIPTLGGTALGVGLGALAVGLVPMVWYWVKRVPYYRTPPLEAFTADHAVPTPRSEAVVVPGQTAAPSAEAIEPV